MSGAVQIRGFLAGDAVQLVLQPSQHVALGLKHAIHSIDDGRELEAAGPAWTATGGGRILCCYGFAEVAPAGPRTGGHALAWALLAANLGAAHVAITRFARATLADSPISRIEAIVRAGVEAERKWAEMVGFELAATLRCWGPEGETHLLFERVREFAQMQEAA
jgi:hypothetical protein